MFKSNSCQETGLNLNPSNNLHFLIIFKTVLFVNGYILVCKTVLAGHACDYLYDIQHLRLHMVYFIAAALAVDIFI